MQATAIVLGIGLCYLLAFIGVLALGQVLYSHWTEKKEKDNAG